MTFNKALIQINSECVWNFRIIQKPFTHNSCYAFKNEKSAEEKSAHEEWALARSQLPKRQKVVEARQTCSGCIAVSF
jgi:hypothetical protein